jgi:signal transduction histidine kinase
MIDAIAHQWQQPLNSLSFYTSTLREDFRTGTIDADHVADITRNMEQQIDHLVTTLSVFRNFYRDDRKNREFSLEQVVRNVMLIMNDQLIKHTVSVVFEPECDVTIKGIENEFKHILINLINNAKEAFESRKLPDRTLNIRIGEDAERFFLTVEDNAGGIPETLLPELFKQHVTTKKETGGSGVGLYLARLIAAKHGMQLSASNVREGACFTLCLPK